MFRFAMILTCLASPLAAQDVCDTLDAAIGDTLTLPQGVAQCSESLALGGARSVHCVLEFAYRSDDATRVFEELVDDVTACIGPDALITEDQSVNHPDAYDLRRFETGDRAYAVSIKDKGALQQTLVFVRVTRP